MNNQNTGKSKNVGSNLSVFHFKDVPKICLLDFEDKDIKLIKSHGFNCSPGSLGKDIEVPNKLMSDRKPCLLQHDYPNGLHEYDVVAINLQSHESLIYNSEDHTLANHSKPDANMLMVEYPTTLFKSRPIASRFLRIDLRKIKKRQSVLVIFTDIKEEYEYKPVSITYQGLEKEKHFSCHNYDFLDINLHSENVSGTKTEVAPFQFHDFHHLLSSINDDCSYNIVFSHPQIYDSKRKISIDKPTFIPLMMNGQKQIISFLDQDEEQLILAFPVIQNKGQFLIDLLDNVLPGFTPIIFPHSTTFSWIGAEPYLLPNEAELQKEKQELEQEYSEKLNELEKRLSHNHKKFEFLHILLSGTDTELVKAVETYLHWLEFPEVINMDETNAPIREEDIQIPISNGLIVIEIKGIHGTSKDSDCSQINKIKFRRAEERGKFDVFALYLVNHQRNLPPKERNNPPFTPHQITDALNEKRGLLTTYSLFKLYYYIEQGIISKSDARESLLEYGLIDFKPSNATLLGCVKELHHKGHVVICEIPNCPVKVGERLIISDRNDLTVNKIIEIQVNNVSVGEVKQGEVGLKLEKPVIIESELWLVKE